MKWRRFLVSPAPDDAPCVFCASLVVCFDSEAFPQFVWNAFFIFLALLSFATVVASHPRDATAALVGMVGAPTSRSLLGQDQLTNTSTVFVDVRPGDSPTTTQLASTYSGSRIKLGANLKDPEGVAAQVLKARGAVSLPPVLRSSSRRSPFLSRKTAFAF